MQVRLGVAAEAGVDPAFGLRRELGQHRLRRRPPVRLGRAPPLGTGLDRQPDPRRRRPAGAGGRLAQDRADAVPRRAVPWLGPWSADVFVGELSQRSGPRPRPSARRPLPGHALAGLELGALARRCSGAAAAATRAWARCGERWPASDNAESGALDDEPGNQLAGFDARYTISLGDGRTLSIYGQGIGEDEANSRPSHYLGSVGVDTAFDAAGGRWRVFVEAADTSMNGAFGTPILGGAYRHHIYTDGYTQRGQPLGHPAGGDVRLASLGAFVRGCLERRRDAPCRPRLQHRADASSRAPAWAARMSRRLALRRSIAPRPGAFPLARGRFARTRAQLWWQQALP